MIDTYMKWLEIIEEQHKVLTFEQEEKLMQQIKGFEADYEDNHNGKYAPDMYRAVFDIVGYVEITCREV